ncbi:5031_t:CDS:2, partial [Funneliformis geosporum]|uniref:6356_t:CDS:1 n=1 Tax=Funneliformis geosporum TaxID=1117311 RepID=A0A9W4SZW8_9GLOM
MSNEVQKLRNELVVEFPGRTRQIDTLINLFGEPMEKTPPSIFIHGNRALGKTEIVKNLFKRGFPTHHYSFLNCKLYFQLDDIFEVSLKHLSGKKHKCKNVDEYATILQEICETAEETRYMIFDNAELLWNLSQTLVSIILNLPQWVFSDSCDLIDLFRIIPDIYQKFIQPINEGRVSINDYSLLFDELKPYLESALDNLYSQYITPLIENQIPTWSIYLLIAAFLASYIPQSLDKRLFSREYEKRKHTRKGRKKVSNALKFNEQFTGPQASEMERIFAIFQSIHQDSVVPYILLLQQTETFVASRVFTRTTPVERKDVQSFRCNLSYNYIKQISRFINFDILRYLDDTL